MKVGFNKDFENKRLVELSEQLLEDRCVSGTILFECGDYSNDEDIFVSTHCWLFFGDDACDFLKETRYIDSCMELIEAFARHRFQYKELEYNAGILILVDSHPLPIVWISKEEASPLINPELPSS